MASPTFRFRVIIAALAVGGAAGCSSSTASPIVDSGSKEAAKPGSDSGVHDAGKPRKDGHVDATHEAKVDAGHDAMIADATPEAEAAVGLTCGGLLGCDQGCSSTPCTNACYDNSTGVAQGLFNAFTNCLNDACSSAVGGPCADAGAASCGSCQTTAATSMCIAELEGCSSDMHVGPPDIDGGGVVVVHMDAGRQLNCGQYTACVAACSGAGGSCPSACAAQATSEATTLASALSGCLATNCSTGDGGPCAIPGSACNGCVEQTEFGGKCEDTYQACQNDTSNTPDASTTPTPLQGGTLATALQGDDQIGSTMTIQGGYLYFAQENISEQVGRIWVGDGGAVDAGPAVHVGPPQPTPVALAVNSSDVYVWNYGTFTGSSQMNNSDGVVNQIPLDGGTPVTVGEHIQVFYSAPYLNAIALDSQNVYWVQGASGSDGEIVKTPLGTSNGTAIYTGQNFPEALATDGTNVYWGSWGTFNAQGDSNNDGTIQQGSITGGTPTTLASGLAAPGCIAIDSKNVYWTSLGKLGGDNLPALNTGGVFQVPIGGGSVVTLATKESVPVSIALTSDTVYWTVYGLGSDGFVMSAPKGGGAVVPLVANLKNPYSLVLSSSALFFSFYAAATPNHSTPLIDSLQPY